jgi:hypothetical protein
MRLCPAVSLLTVLAVCLATPRPAEADLTAFYGATMTPSARSARGLSGGVSLLVIGFEFEYSNTSEDIDEAAPSLTTGMGNFVIQTPTRLQFYFSTGVGFYRERLGSIQETSYGFNTGGGAKIPLIGPLRARIDYRVFSLRGDPRHATTQRVYVGANIAF